MTNRCSKLIGTYGLVTYTCTRDPGHSGQCEWRNQYPEFAEPGDAFVVTKDGVQKQANGTVAEEAHSIAIDGARQEEYGDPLGNFQRTADAINGIYGTEFEARDIPVIMILTKIARSVASPEKRDHFVDICGYALTREIVADKEGRPLV